MDPITQHARAGSPDGECRRRSLYCAGAPPDVPAQLRALPRTDRALPAALSKTPERIALREIGETFVLPS